MTSEYDEATTFELTGNRATARLSSDWGIGNAVNGGIIMSLLAQVTSSVSRSAGGHGDVLGLSAVFLSPGADGAAEVSTDVLRNGRSMTTAQTLLSQEDERVRAFVTLGDIDRYAEPITLNPQPPAMPEPDACVRSSDAPPDALSQSGLLSRVDIRLDPACVGWAVGQPSGNGELRGWIRFADGREPDLHSLLLFLDAFPPVTFDLGAKGWVPTVQFSGYLHARPAPGWLQVRTRTTTVAGGLHEEDAQIWDSTGRLVAQSRQLASARF
ncbi:acyl-CoA thioesterase [Branchiibius hedensis]|uniref:Acyl-CoA thioesterase n=1 Tax=Branchiibius hedensis TaxID=672460 RepID=A0A2Y9BTL0_9MICO|nr:thioesterase family protein [Branchiibius hedensis]PWJ25368.1 acyl-CoA thioesterase [Branchiibius hedensis]SSA34182.1 Acyl-CoA thioesterase [Branchiibius hedensis]